MLRSCNLLSCTDCGHKAHFFDRMTQEDLALLNQNRKEITYKKKELICKQGQPPQYFICMYEGLAKLYIEAQTNVSLQIIPRQNYIGVQTLFGENSVNIKNSVYHYSVVALENCSACLIDINSFKEVIRRNSLVGFELLNYIGSLESSLLKKMFSISARNSRGRIADTIIYLSDLLNTDVLDTRLTRKDIAELSSTSLENTIRIMSEFNQEKIIRLDGRKIDIINKKLLKQIQEFG